MADPGSNIVLQGVPVSSSLKHTSILSSNQQPGSILTNLFWNLATFMTQALSFLFLSKIIHYFVQCLDEIYDASGRRSRSKFEVVSWTRIFLGMGLLVVWHVWIVRLSSVSASQLEDREKEGGADAEKREKSVSWGRVLGRILVPAFLTSSGAVWSVQLTSRLFFPLAVEENQALTEGLS